LNVLFLLTDGYGNVGGISQFNRDFLAALNASAAVTRVQAIPRLIPNSIEETIPEAVVYDRKAAGNKLRFAWRTLEHARFDPAVNVVICGHIHLLPAAYAVAWMRQARLVLILHGVEAWRSRRNWFTLWLIRSVDAFLVVSRLTAERFSSWSGAPSERFTVLPNCVNLDRFVPQHRDPSLLSRYGLDGCKVILTVGRLEAKERYKGFDEVLEVLPGLVFRFPNLKYLIVGGGEDRSRLAAKAETLGIAKNVVFTGRIPEEEKVAHFNLAHVYAMPSSGEGFGIVLLEAAACGIPVIGSSADGSREALMGGKLGTLVDPQKPEQLTAALVQALERDHPRQKPAALDHFGFDQFRIRIGQWLQREAAACSAKQKVA
jgi:glycosyltransferase involved in cell wall biosynthesis